jgi:serine/threonine protein kinase
VRRIGPLNELDLAFLHNPSKVSYLAKIQNKNDQICEDYFRNKFSAIEDEGLVNLLVDLLEFNPEFRPTSSDCLKRDIFSDLR